MTCRHSIAAAACAAVFQAVAQPVPGDIVFAETFDTIPLGRYADALPNGWTVTGGTIDVIGAGGSDPKPGHGHYIDLQDDSGHAVLAHTIPVPAPGLYDVFFHWAGNPQGEHGALRVDIGPVPMSDGSLTIIDVSSATPFLMSTSRGQFGTGSFLLRFSTPASVTLADGTTFVPDTGLLLDDISVRFTQAIPEPATAWLLGLGLATLAWRARSCRHDRKGVSP